MPLTMMKKIICTWNIEILCLLLFRYNKTVHTYRILPTENQMLAVQVNFRAVFLRLHLGAPIL